jgi:amino acid permease
MNEAIYSFLKQSGDILNILGMVGIALLTVLIPVAVAIFNDKKDFEVLDKNVILDHVVNARYFLIYLALVYVPILIWGGSSYALRALELIVWAVGIYFIARVLINAYHWMKGNKFMLRFDYLRKLNNPKDMEESWRSVWEAKNINTQNEKEFFTIFSAAIDNLLKNDDRKT